MTIADFIYEIDPEVGEYRFTRKPEIAEGNTETRVRSLAGSFQWLSAVQTSESLVAIAVDNHEPIVVAKFTVDNRDPHGRVSIRLEAFVANSWNSAKLIVDEIWPAEFSLPTSKQGFIEAAQANSENGTRRFQTIVGPNGKFSASGFDKAFGTTLTAHSVSATSHTESLQLQTERGESQVKRIGLYSGTLCILLIAGITWLYVDKSRTEAQLKNELNKVRAKVEDMANASQLEVRTMIDEHHKLKSEHKKNIEQWQKASQRNTPDELENRISSLEDNMKPGNDPALKEKLRVLEKAMAKVTDLSIELERIVKSYNAPTKEPSRLNK